MENRKRKNSLHQFPIWLYSYFFQEIARDAVPCNRNSFCKRLKKCSLLKTGIHTRSYMCLCEPYILMQAKILLRKGMGWLWVVFFKKKYKLELEFKKLSLYSSFMLIFDMCLYYFYIFYMQSNSPSHFSMQFSVAHRLSFSTHMTTLYFEMKEKVT